MMWDNANLMTWTFTGKDESLFPMALEIREKVFVQEQKIPAELEPDEYDQTAQHLLLMVNGQAVGTARWRLTEKGVKLERFAVLKEHRKKGVGTILIEKIFTELGNKKKKAYLHSQESAVEFYARNNFVITGEPFEEAGILHFEMIYCK